MQTTSSSVSTCQTKTIAEQHDCFLLLHSMNASKADFVTSLSFGCHKNVSNASLEKHVLLFSLGENKVIDFSIMHHESSDN